MLFVKNLINKFLDLLVHKMMQKILKNTNMKKIKKNLCNF